MRASDQTIGPEARTSRQNRAHHSRTHGENAFPKRGIPPTSRRVSQGFRPSNQRVSGSRSEIQIRRDPSSKIQPESRMGPRVRPWPRPRARPPWRNPRSTRKTAPRHSAPTLTVHRAPGHFRPAPDLPDPRLSRRTILRTPPWRPTVIPIARVLLARALESTRPAP